MLAEHLLIGAEVDVLDEDTALVRVVIVAVLAHVLVRADELAFFFLAGTRLRARLARLLDLLELLLQLLELELLLENRLARLPLDPERLLRFGVRSGAD